MLLLLFFLTFLVEYYKGRIIREEFKDRKKLAVYLMCYKIFFAIIFAIRQMVVN